MKLSEQLIEHAEWASLSNHDLWERDNINIFHSEAMKTLNKYYPEIVWKQERIFCALFEAEIQNDLESQRIVWEFLNHD